MVLIFAATLVAYNNLLNLWPPFNRHLYVPLNVVATAAAVVVGVSLLDLNLGSIGLRTLEVGDLMLGIAVGGAAVLPLVALALSRRGARFVADQRVAGLGGGQLAYQTLVRIPLGTALLEEVAFRGVLFAALRHLGGGRAALYSSLAFALWHITPTLNLVEANEPHPTRAKVAAALLATAIFTTAAGCFFVWLRVRTGSLGAPLGLHATFNSVATVAGVLAHRRRAGPPRPRSSAGPDPAPERTS